MILKTKKDDLVSGDIGDKDMKIGDIQFYAKSISYWCNIMRSLLALEQEFLILVDGSQLQSADKFFA